MPVSLPCSTLMDHCRHVSMPMWILSARKDRLVMLRFAASFFICLCALLCPAAVHDCLHVYMVLSGNLSPVDSISVAVWCLVPQCVLSHNSLHRTHGHLRDVFGYQATRDLAGESSKAGGHAHARTKEQKRTHAHRPHVRRRTVCTSHSGYILGPH